MHCHLVETYYLKHRKVPEMPVFPDGVRGCLSMQYCLNLQHYTIIYAEQTIHCSCRLHFRSSLGYSPRTAACVQMTGKGVVVDMLLKASDNETDDSTKHESPVTDDIHVTIGDH